MNENILKKVRELQERAKREGKENVEKVEIRSFLENGNSLNDVIKTKEDADLFMKRLNALHK